MAELETGALVASHYVVVSLLGAGGMGAVYRVRDTRTDTLHALKVLRRARGDLATRFIREARIAAALAHPNIARVHEVLELDDGTPAIVMELLEGESLGAHLARSGKLPAATIARTCIGVVAAIKAAHERGVVHRDLKPDNIFLCGDGTVKVLDFGIAKVTFESSDPAITAAALTETGQILGTPQYMAPEQIFGEKDVDARADIWALGVILYQALAGVRPFDGANPGQVFKAIALDPPVPLVERAPQAPPELIALVARLLVHARAERLADLDHVTRVLERIVADDLGEAATLRASGADLAVAVAPKVRAVSRAGGTSPRRAIIIVAASAAAIGAAAVAVGSRSPALPREAATATSPATEQTPAPAPAHVPSASSHEGAKAPPPSSASTTAPAAAPSVPERPPSSPAARTPPPSIRAVSVAPGAASAANMTTALDAGTTRTNRSGPLKRDEF